jgi:hypothetical protein
MVALTWLEKHIDKLRGRPVVDEKPQHWNCQHPTQDNPAKWFKRMEKRKRLDAVVDMVRVESSPDVDRESEDRIEREQKHIYQAGVERGIQSERRELEFENL